MGREILLVEDDESLNRAISFKLSKEGYTVYPAADIRDADRIWHAHKVPLVICDIDLPDGSGLDFCIKVRKESDVVFIFLTAMDTEDDMMKGYKAGADDYITKPFFLPVLVSKVNAIMQRYTDKEQADIIISGDITYFCEENRVKKKDGYINLTANELKLLSFFMQNPMRILAKEQLLEAIWDVDGNFVDENTLAVNIRRLREKIEDEPSAPEVLKNVRGLGYIWDKECRRR